MTPTTTQAKRPHDLHTARDLAAFRSLLSARGIDLDEVVDRYARRSDGVGVLVAGSLAEGVGNATSDVDVVLLVDDAGALQDRQPGLPLRAGRAREFLVYEGGVELNIECFTLESTLRLVEAMISLAPALYEPTQVESLALLQPYDLRFLHRLRSGWIVSGPEVVERWRDELMVDLIGVYIAVRNLVAFSEHLEDAYALLTESPVAAQLVARTTAEHVLFALAAAAGFTSPSRKWLTHWIARIDDPERRVLGERAIALILEGYDPRRTRALVEDVASLGAETASVLERDVEVGRAIGFVRERITYTDPT